MPRPFTAVVSHALVLDRDDVDTDQIIPARFLTTTEQRGLGRHLFADWRTSRHSQGTPRFVLDTPEATGAQILIAGRNFGCGSSREHAPWALTDFGVRVVIARSFADIFRGNALKNALLPVSLDDAAYLALRQRVASEPQLQLTVDLETNSLTLPDGPRWSFEIPPFSRRCLLDGVDEFGYLLAAEDDIAAWESRSSAAAAASASGAPAAPRVSVT